MSRTPVRRSGLTLVEVLVMLAIITVLVALLLPSVGRRRGDYRRSSCKNNLKQIGLAMHEYHETHGIFPPGALWKEGDQPTCNARLMQSQECLDQMGPSWMVFLLPFMDNGPLFDHYTPDEAMTAPAPSTNTQVRSTFLKSYICPTDSFATSTNPFVAEEELTPHTTMARTSYGGNTGRLTGGTHLYRDSYRELPVDRRGVFGNQGAARIREIVDGTSNTIAVWEIRAGTVSSDRRGVWAIGPGNLVGGCDNQGDCNGINDQSGSPDDVHHCVDRRQVQMPCWSGGDGQHGPKSLHTGGCHALMADGSVKFCSEKMEMNRIMRGLNGISDREDVDDAF